MKLLCFYFLLLVPPWGFYAHKWINRMAVFLQPPELFVFLKKHIHYISEQAVNPDKRRYAVVGEAERHYIDLDEYSIEEKLALPSLTWEKAVEKYTEDSLRARGIVPWQIIRMKHQLTEAFTQRDVSRIVKLCTDIGHYIADAHVPLHTTKNYNGQFTGQNGIHGLWESRLPELYLQGYDMWIGKAKYEPRIQERVWKAVFDSHAAVDSVLSFEKRLSEDKKFTIEERNGTLVKTYSSGFSAQYHKALQDQVERRMRAAIQTVADIWYTAWSDAGKPDLGGDLIEIQADSIPRGRALKVREEN